MRSVAEKFVEKIKTHSVSIFFFLLWKSYRLWDNVDKFGTAGQAIDENIAWLMRVACWIPKATDAHSECVIIIACSLQQWLHERPQCYVLPTLPVLLRNCEQQYWSAGWGRRRLPADCSTVANVLNSLKPNGHYMYRTVVTICTAQWSLCTAQWSLYVPHSGHYMYRTVVTICTAQWSLYVPPSGHYMYHQFNIQQFYFLPTQLYLCVLCGSQNKQPLFPYTTLTDWFL